MRVRSSDSDSECRDALAQAKAWTALGSISKRGDKRDEFYSAVPGTSPSRLA